THEETVDIRSREDRCRLPSPFGPSVADQCFTSKKHPTQHISPPGEHGGKREIGERIFGHQSGMLSCFFHGFSSCLLRSLRSPIATRRRVECGMMTSSIKPLLAATKGLAKRSSYSRVRSAISSFVLPRKMISTAPLAPITAISAVGQA